MEFKKLPSYLRWKLNVGTWKEWQERGRGLAYFYQRIFFYISAAKNEILKPLGFWNETVLILTFLSVRFHLNPAFTSVLLAYLIVLFVAAIAGKLLVITGILKYNGELTSDQNPQLMLALSELKEIKDLLKNQKNLNRPVDEKDTEN